MCSEHKSNLMLDMDYPAVRNSSIDKNFGLSDHKLRYTNVELGMNATERIVEYSRIPTEDQSRREDANGGTGQVLTTVPAAWPKEGQLEVNGLVAGYAPDLPPVLKGLSFNVSKNQRIGVIGRTGAGKSSLTLALFRFLEAREGSIHIDGVDISKISLYDLRSRLAIIPQDPVLFSGTLRQYFIISISQMYSLGYMLRCFVS